MREHAPIGIFDSGVGGLTIWHELVNELPNESFIYVADSANCPYGVRTNEEIRELVDRGMRYFVSRGCKAAVIACNTATAAAIYHLRAHYQIPIIGIEPAIKVAAEATKTNKIGVLATRFTCNSEFLKRTIQNHARGVEVFLQPGDGLVELVETGRIDEPETKELLESYLKPMIEAGADHIVLGCTHYPFLWKLMEAAVAGSATLVNPAAAVARQTRKVLEEENIRNKNNFNARTKYFFYTSGSPVSLRRMFDLLPIDRESASAISVEKLSI